MSSTTSCARRSGARRSTRPGCTRSAGSRSGRTPRPGSDPPPGDNSCRGGTEDGDRSGDHPGAATPQVDPRRPSVAPRQAREPDGGRWMTLRDEDIVTTNLADATDQADGGGDADQSDSDST